MVTTILIYPLTPRLKPKVMQSFQTFDSMNRTLKYGKLLRSTVLYCGAVFFFQVLILENLHILDLALSGVEG